MIQERNVAPWSRVGMMCFSRYHEEVWGGAAPSYAVIPGWSFKSTGNARAGALEKLEIFGVAANSVGAVSSEMDNMVLISIGQDRDTTTNQVIVKNYSTTRGDNTLTFQEGQFVFYEEWGEDERIVLYPGDKYGFMTGGLDYVRCLAGDPSLGSASGTSWSAASDWKGWGAILCKPHYRRLTHAV